MAKTDATRRRTRQSKVVTNKGVEEEDNVNTEGQVEPVSSNEQKVRKEEVGEQEEEDQDKQDSQMDAVIEVKGSQSTVTVSYAKKNEEGEADDVEKGTNASDQMMDTEEQTQVVSSADTVDSTEDAPSESTETKMSQEIQESGESQMDTVIGENESKPIVTVTWEKKNKEGERDNLKQEKGNGKRKAHSTVETSPSKKTKLINDGFCLFVGNLDNSKTFEEIKDALGNYFMTQSLLVQDIRLDKSKKHAYVDLASEMDLTKALMLNGQMVLEKPMKIEKAKIKGEETVKVKATAEDKKAKDARCLFLKNVPYKATKEDILKIFGKAVAVRFPGGTKGPNKGIAFVEFENKAIAEKVQQKEAKIQDRVLIVDFVRQANEPKVAETNDENTKAEAPPNKTLFVSKLPYGVKVKNLKEVFPKAVTISIPQSKGKSKGFAFVEFATVADAEKALKSSKSVKIGKREASVQFSKRQEMSEKAKVLSKTLIVMGLAEKTTAETLKSAFEGALSARVTVNKETGASKRFGFVEFESDENCKAVKEAMEDCEIDGSKVTVAYAKPKCEERPAGARGGRGGPPAGQKAARGRKGSRRGPGGGAVKEAVKECC